MDMTEEKNSFDDLISHAEDYLKTKQELSTLLALEKGSAIIAKATSGIIIFSFLMFFFVFASIALGWIIAEYTGKTSTGFLSVAGLYLVTGILLYINRKNWLEVPMMNTFIKSYYESKTHE